MIEVVRVRIMLIGYPWFLVFEFLNVSFTSGCSLMLLEIFLSIWCFYLLIGVSFLCYPFLKSCLLFTVC